jgi:hypothetical protein
MGIPAGVERFGGAHRPLGARVFAVMMDKPGRRCKSKMPRGEPMRMIIGWFSATVLGAIGWWLGAYVNLGVAVILSAITGAMGLYYGFRWFDQNLR